MEAAPLHPQAAHSRPSGLKATDASLFACRIAGPTGNAVGTRHGQGRVEATGQGRLAVRTKATANNVLVLQGKADDFAVRK